MVEPARSGMRGLSRTLSLSGASTPLPAELRLLSAEEEQIGRRAAANEVRGEKTERERNSPSLPRFT